MQVLRGSAEPFWSFIAMGLLLPPLVLHAVPLHESFLEAHEAKSLTQLALQPNLVPFAQASTSNTDKIRSCDWQ